MSKFTDGIIDPGDPIGQEIGFFPELFDGYLWVDGDYIYIASIWSKHPGKGNFKTLVNNIEKAGMKIAVPAPLPLMVAILTKWGYKPHEEFFIEIMENIEVWTK